MNLEELARLVDAGESERVEFKKTTGQRSEAMLCRSHRVRGFVDPTLRLWHEHVVVETMRMNTGAQRFRPDNDIRFAAAGFRSFNRPRLLAYGVGLLRKFFEMLGSFSRSNRRLAKQPC